MGLKVSLLGYRAEGGFCWTESLENAPIWGTFIAQFQEFAYPIHNRRLAILAAACTSTIAAVSRRNIRRCRDSRTSAKAPPINVNTKGSAQIHGSERTSVVSMDNRRQAISSGVVFPKYRELR